MNKLNLYISKDRKREYISIITDAEWEKELKEDTELQLVASVPIDEGYDLTMFPTDRLMSQE